MKRRPVTRRLSGAYQRGEGLVEVLVAVLVLAIGLLGIAMMQTRALSGNNSTTARSMAVVASYSILEAMRIDRANAIASKYNTTMYGNNCTVTTTTTALAQNQLINWCNDLAAKLGPLRTTQGKVNCDTNGTCLITIQFDDSKVGQGGDAAMTVKTQAAL